LEPVLDEDSLFTRYERAGRDAKELSARVYAEEERSAVAQVDWGVVIDLASCLAQFPKRHHHPAIGGHP
jgi:hypothetical protein